MIFIMDVGGLNGALLDPMSMTDAELLDVNSLPDIEEALGVNNVDDVTSALGQPQPIVDTARVNELEKLISDKDAQILSLTSEINSLKSSNNSLNEKVELFEDEKIDLEDQFRKVQSTNENQLKKIADLETVVGEKEARINTLEAEVKDAVPAVDTQDLETKLEEQTEKSTQLENKIKQMETDSDALTKRNQDLIGAKNKKISELNADIADLKGKVSEHETEKTSLESRVQEIQVTVTSKDEEIRNLQRTITDLKQCNEAMAEKEQEIVDLKSHMEELSLKHKSISEEKNKLETDNKILNEQVTKAVELNGNNESLQKEIDSLKSEKQSLEEKLVETEKSTAEMKENISSLAEENNALSSKVEEAVKKSETLEQEKEVMSKEMTELETEKADLSSRLANNEQKGLELTLVQTQLSETQKREAKLKTEVAALTEKVTSVDAKCNLYSSEISKAVTASKHFEEQNNILKAELETTKKHKVSLEQAAGNLSKLSHEKAAVDQRCAEFAKRCGDLERKVAGMKTLEQQVMGLNSANVQMNNELHNSRNELHQVKQHNDTLARECSNYKNQADQNNKYMRDYSMQNGELQKKNLELSNLLKVHEAESQRFKTQMESLSKQASQQADYGSLKSQVNSLTKVLAETKQEAINYMKDSESKDKDLNDHRLEIDRLNKEVLILQKSIEVNNDNSKSKKKFSGDEKGLHKELQSCKKDLEAARRENTRLEKELMEKEKENAKQKVNLQIF